MLGIGIDTGGTYTDAVVYDMETKEVLCSGKALTTKSRLEIGISQALDLLDPKAVKQAKLLALSTTLATNACLEDKGGRAKLLMIGVDTRDRELLEKACSTYGFRDMSQLVFLDGKPEHIFQEPQEPDWSALKSWVPEKFGDCAAAGIVQIYPRADGGRLEKRAKEVLKGEMDIQVTMAHEMFDEVGILKRGAGTFLNARLIPLISEFLQAVLHVMEERGLSMPVAIMRSDGSLMTEDMARECPVETLLSGPAASVVGGSVLADTENAVIVDMGGTTTDVALVRRGLPVTAKRGISIGKWQTNVKGLYVDTFLLGGDSGVRFGSRGMYLDSGRVIPISLLAHQYPRITDRLRRLAEEHRQHTRMLSECYVLQKEISRLEDYTEEEQRICAVLRDGPLLVEELAQRLETHIYGLHTRRLEEEGVVMKSGLTPTDMMVVKGDFPVYAPDAALASLEVLAENVPETAAEIPDRVYELVEKKLYCNIARILIRQKYPLEERAVEEESLKRFLEWAYEDAVRGERGEWISLPIRAEMPIVGVGAPIHIFLPRVARLLGTEAVLNRYSAVANALGAIASQIVSRVQVRVKAEYDGSQLTGYSVYVGQERRMFEEYEEAERLAVSLARQQVLEKARRQGASGNPRVEISVRKITSGEENDGVLFESIVEGTAVDQFRLPEFSS